MFFTRQLEEIEARFYDAISLSEMMSWMAELGGP